MKKDEALTTLSEICDSLRGGDSNDLVFALVISEICTLSSMGADILVHRALEPLMTEASQILNKPKI